MTRDRAGDADTAPARVARLETPAARAFALIGIADGFAARKAGDCHARP
jgi:hypothetical protein